MITSKSQPVIITCKIPRQYSTAGLIIFLAAIVGLFLSNLSLRSFRPVKKTIYVDFMPFITPSIRRPSPESLSTHSATNSSSTNHSDFKPNFIVLLTCSDGFFQMWENWLAFFEKLEIPNLPVHLFAEDKITFQRCMDTKKRLKNKRNETNRSRYEVDVSCLAWETVFTEPTEKKISALGYRKSGYVKMMSHRPFIIQKELEKGNHVIFSDVDALWLKSPLPYFENDFNVTSNKDSSGDPGGSPSSDAAEEISIWAQMDLPRGKYQNFCPGFMVYRSTPEMIQFVQMWGHAISRGTKLKRNQGTFNEMILDPKKYNVSKIETKSLPIDLFVTGKLYFENMTDAERKEVVVVHNNGISGYDVKVKRFKNFNLWVVDQ
ncbi:hypothetical protein ACHAXS_004684 [Conticribra weissflogii]